MPVDHDDEVEPEDIRNVDPEDDALAALLVGGQSFEPSIRIGGLREDLVVLTAGSRIALDDPHGGPAGWCEVGVENDSADGQSWHRAAPRRCGYVSVRA